MTNHNIFNKIKNSISKNVYSKKLKNKTKKNYKSFKTNAKLLSNKTNKSLKYLLKLKNKHSRRNNSKSKHSRRNNSKSKHSRRNNSKSKHSRSLKGGSNCNEYAYINEPGINIPSLDSIPGLSIEPSKASIGKIKTCPTVNHP